MLVPPLAADLAPEPASVIVARDEEEAAVGSAPAVPVRFEPMRFEPSRSRKLLPVSIAVSAALHVAAAAAMLNSSSALPDFGVLDHPSETLSLAITQTVVLDSIVTQPVSTASAAAAALPQGTIQSIDAEPTPLTKAEEVEEETISPPQPIKTAEVAEQATSSVDPLEVVRGSGERAEITPAKAQEMQPEKEQPQAGRQEQSKKRRQLAQRLRSKAATAGGPSSRATIAATASGQVSASRGSVLSYGALVRAKVARNKPSSHGREGVAKVSFGVSPTGDLRFAELSGSSGDTTLDAAALSAVREAAPFGPPPAGTAPEQLRFSIRFTFR
jgi:periplasmic protein TonB